MRTQASRNQGVSRPHEPRRFGTRRANPEGDAPHDPPHALPDARRRLRCEQRPDTRRGGFRPRGARPLHVRREHRHARRGVRQRLPDARRRPGLRGVRGRLRRGRRLERHRGRRVRDERDRLGNGALGQLRAVPRAVRRDGRQDRHVPRDGRCAHHDRRRPRHRGRGAAPHRVSRAPLHRRSRAAARQRELRRTRAARPRRRGVPTPRGGPRVRALVVHVHARGARDHRSAADLGAPPGDRSLRHGRRAR